MISRPTLSAAVDAGIVTADQARRLVELEAARAVEAPPVDEERLRFITGFGDIFVAVGLALFLGSLGYILSTANAFAMCVGLAVAAWGLAEFFTRRRRMALPSILLLLVFTAAVGWTALALAGGIAQSFSDMVGATPGPGSVVTAGFAAAAAAALHYRRFAVPVTAAAGAGALVAMAVALLHGLAPMAAERLQPFLLAGSGVVLFLVALRLDRLDPERMTRRTDIAFWLHLLAAPLIVHPVMQAAEGIDPELGLLATLAVFLLLTAAALAADRRAILVSGLIYAGTAITGLIGMSGLQGDLTAALAPLCLGILILVLSVAWQATRRVLLDRLPPAWAAWLPQAGAAPR